MAQSATEKQFYSWRVRTTISYQFITMCSDVPGHFRAVGQIINYSMLHQGPLVYGLTPAVLEYWRSTASGNDDDRSLENLPLRLEDVADMNLRDYIIQVT